MKKLKFVLALLLITAGFYSCQKEEAESISAIEQDVVVLKTEAYGVDCTSNCIDPENPVWFEKTDQKVVRWAGPDGDRFSKIVDIIYYNTLEYFVLKVRSTEDIAHLLVDNNSVKEFSNPLPAGTWYELSFPIPDNWEVCDDYAFELSVIGNGPQVFIDVEYQLVGECTYDPNAFITTWDTSKGFWGSVMVRIVLTGSVNATIDWGDGTITTATTPGEYGHFPSQPGIYTVSITGSATGFYVAPFDQSFETESPAVALISVDNWGQLGLQSLANAFDNASNLISVPNNTLGLEGVTNMRYMFQNASSFNHDISNWDVSNVTTMDGIFWGASSFNQDIGGWDVSNVTVMRYMFQNASSFNHDISNWNVSNVTTMFNMFYGASSFNQNIGDWDVSNVTHMAQMFRGASSFNQDIGGWNVSKVTNMDSMFRVASSFNQDLSGWCVLNIDPQPDFFDLGATSWVLPRPVWGTCPE